jgi:hypothetical protein
MFSGVVQGLFLFAEELVMLVVVMDNAAGRVLSRGPCVEVVSVGLNFHVRVVLF